MSNFDSSLLGTISMKTTFEQIIDDDNNIDEYSIEIDNESISSDESQQTIYENQNERIINEYNHSSKFISFDKLPNKKLLWSLNFKFVPQYIVLYRQSILFASDRWGFVRYY